MWLLWWQSRRSFLDGRMLQSYWCGSSWQAIWHSRCSDSMSRVYSGELKMIYYKWYKQWQSFSKRNDGSTGLHALCICGEPFGAHSCTELQPPWDLHGSRQADSGQQHVDICAPSTSNAPATVLPSSQQSTPPVARVPPPSNSITPIPPVRPHIPLPPSVARPMAPASAAFAGMIPRDASNVNRERMESAERMHARAASSNSSRTRSTQMSIPPNRNRAGGSRQAAPPPTERLPDTDSVLALVVPFNVSSTSRILVILFTHWHPVSLVKTLVMAEPSSYQI